VKAKQIYRFAVYGAAGGLAGSLLHHATLLNKLAGTLEIRERFYCLALLGALLGAAIGFFPRFFDGLNRYAPARAMRLGLLGALLGALGGALTLPLAELLHAQLRGGLSGRTLAWAVLGAAVGWGEALSGGARRWRSLMGGVIGGALAGLLLELLLRSQQTYRDSGILALIIVGSIISLAVALSVNVLLDAWLEGLEGGAKIEGQLFPLGKFRDPQKAELGTSSKAYIHLRKGGPVHATITLTSQGAILRNMAQSGQTRVNGVPVQTHELRSGEEIEVGDARLRYKERRREGRY
jgi:hypothetical protein